MRISAEDFIRIWWESNSLKEVAKKTGLHPSSAHSRMKTYLKKGINLKRFPMGMVPLDVPKLKKLADDLAKKHGKKM